MASPDHNAGLQAHADVILWYNGTIPLLNIQTSGISIIPQMDQSAVVIGRFSDAENDRSHHGARLSVGELQVRKVEQFIVDALLFQ